MIVVIGGTGRIGRHMIHELAARHLAARIVTRDPANAAGILGFGLSIAMADLNDESSLAQALQGAESALVLLSPAPNNPNQLEHGRNLLRAALSANVRHIVYVSSYLPSIACMIPRNRNHAMFIDELRSSRIQSTILRVNYVFQNLERFYADQISTTGCFSVSEDEDAAKIAMVDARDVAAAAVECLNGSRHQGREYLVTGPEDVTFHCCANEIAAATGSPVSCIVRDPESQRAALASLSLSGDMIDAMMLTARQFRDGLFSGVTDTVPKVTGRPAISLTQFARDFASSFRRKDATL